MTSIILAFIAGVLVGIVCMRVTYGERLEELVRDFEGLKIKWAVLKGQYDVLRNITVGPEKGDSENVLP